MFKNYWKMIGKKGYYYVNNKLNKEKGCYCGWLGLGGGDGLNLRFG